MRDRIMAQIGTSEPWVIEHGNVAVNYRRPLRIDEVNRLPPDDPNVRLRPGRA